LNNRRNKRRFSKVKRGVLYREYLKNSFVDWKIVLFWIDLI